jgi:DNA-binding transcriptional LysR family regulator
LEFIVPFFEQAMGFENGQEETCMKDLANLEVFAAVGNQRSFSRAAERLGLTKSSVSRKIKELESELGVKLINRDNRRFELTNQGAVLLECGSDVLKRAEQAFDEVRSVQQGFRGLISISATADLADQFLADAITAFRLENSEVRFHLDLSPQVRDLVSEHFDLAIRIGPLKDSGLVARKLCDRQRHFFASAPYLKRRGKPENAGNLAQHALIMTARVCVDGVWLQPSIRANRMGFVRELVRRGAGIGLIDPAVIPSDQAEAYIPVLPTITVPPTSIYLVFPHNNPPRRVTEFVKKVMQCHAARGD